MQRVLWLSHYIPIILKKLVSAIPVGLKCETRNSCYRLQYRYIYFIRLFFGIDITKKSLHHQDSSFRVMRGSYKIEEN